MIGQRQIFQLSRRSLSSLNHNQSMKFNKLNFDDPQSAFRSRTTFEIARALVVFKICSLKWIVQNAGKILQVSNQIVGQRVTNFAIQKTFFAHFCAGEDSVSIRPVIKRLESQGIHSILDFAAEKDKKADEVIHSGIQSRAYNELIEEQECDDNVEIFLECIKAASQFDNGFAAIKVTGLGRPILLEALASVVYAVRKAFIDLDEDGTNAINFETFFFGIKKLGVELSENEARELFERFDTDKNGIIDIIEWTEYLKVEDLQTRPFFVKTKSTEQKGILPCLDADQLRQFENLMSRIDKLADVAQKSKVRLMIDAEQTYFQPGIDHVVMNLQRKYNKNFPVIFSTYQAYLKDAHHRLSIDLQRARNENFKFAAKIVRGAYMVAERRRAKELGIADPIHENIQATHACYHSCLDLMFKNIDMCEVMIASHNQNSIEYATHKMKELNIPAKDGGVYFGQLLGMSDHVSLTLGQNGYNAFKYVPFGPIDQVVPYLIRRLEENSAILKGVGVDKERKMLRQEFFRRLFSFGK